MNEHSTKFAILPNIAPSKWAFWKVTCEKSAVEWNSAPPKFARFLNLHFLKTAWSKGELLEIANFALTKSASEKLAFSKLVDSWNVADLNSAVPSGGNEVSLKSALLKNSLWKKSARSAKEARENFASQWNSADPNEPLLNFVWSKEGDESSWNFVPANPPC